MLATGSFSLISLAGDDFLMEGGWRIPFLASIVLIGVGFWIRWKVEESPIFEEDAAADAAQPAEARDAEPQGAASAEKGSESNAPVLFALKNNWLPILIGMGAIPIATGGYYLTTTFAQAYATDPEIGVPTTLILNAMTLASFLELLVTMPIAALADRIGRRVTISLGVIATGVLIAPLFLSFSTGNAVLIFVLVAAVRITMSMTYAPTAAFLARCSSRGAATPASRWPTESVWPSTAAWLRPRPACSTARPGQSGPSWASSSPSARSTSSA